MRIRVNSSSIPSSQLFQDLLLQGRWMPLRSSRYSFLGCTHISIKLPPSLQWKATPSYLDTNNWIHYISNINGANSIKSSHSQQYCPPQGRLIWLAIPRCLLLIRNLTVGRHNPRYLLCLDGWQSTNNFQIN